MSASEWIVFGALCVALWPALKWLGSLSRRRPTKRDTMTPAEKAKANADIEAIMQASRPANLDDHPRMRAGSAWGRDF